MVAPEGNRYIGNILLDDQLLSAALSARGLSSVRVDWSRPDVDWSRFRCSVFRTTWDYFDRFDEFTTWLARAERQTTLCNAPPIIRWNMDKHYLADLEAKGVPIVPCRFVERGSEETLLGLIESTGWEDAILKPCVSGGARHTYRVHRGNAGDVEPILRQLLPHKAFILQPFQDDIVRTGEDTLMVLNGRYTHAVRKVAKQGDFRVQDDHGGTVHNYEPTREQMELAERAMALCEPAPAYGRVDMVRDNEGRHAIMEVELIEPELWLRHHPPAAELLAEAIAEAVRTSA
jgi:glutathione synthase/RimK-type ligase-like ATP-grasp enzyme